MKDLGYIVHVMTPGKGGGETRSYQVAQALSSREINVHLYGAVDCSFRWNERVCPHILNTPSPRAIQQLMRDFSRYRIESAIERYQFPVFNVGYSAQLIRRKPIVFEMHGFPVDEFAIMVKNRRHLSSFVPVSLMCLPLSFWNRLQLLQLRHAKHIIVTSQGTRIILNSFGIPDGHISVVYNCADTVMFDSSLLVQDHCRYAFRLPTDRKIILYAGSLFHEELATVIKAVAAIKVMEPRVFFLLAGLGPMDEIQAISRTCGLTEHDLQVWPPIPHRMMPHLLAASDVVLAPYRLNSERFSKGFHYSPLKIMEALAMEKPVVTVNAEELRAVFGALPNVGFATSGEAASWAEEIIRALDLCGSPELAAGRSFILNGYRWEDAARKYLDILEAVSEAER